MRKSVSIPLVLLVSLVLAPTGVVLQVVSRSGTIPEVHNPLVYRPASLASPGSPPFTPSDIRKAYNFTPLYSRGINGTGTRIAIIDAFGSSSLSLDLASFNSATGLPGATVNTYYPDGAPKATDQTWALETSLDVEWAHAIAPAATIDLVVAPDFSLAHLFDAISFVADSLSNETVLSMSFALPESSYPTTGPVTIATIHQLFATMTSQGTTPIASSGDSAARGCCLAEYPASDPLVLAVGGTTLTLKTDSSYSDEEVWFGTTAGASGVFNKPPYQIGLGNAMRDTVDVAYDADPDTGVLVIHGGTRMEVGGTSVGSPQWTSLIALASQASSARFGAISPRLYTLHSYHDVVNGTDGFFDASKGWDYPTGMGTPDANATVNALSAKPGDMALTRIQLSRDLAYSGVASNPVTANVTVENLAPVDATISVSLKTNATVQGSQTVTVPGGQRKVVTFQLNTLPLGRGKYVISANASSLPGETNLANNSLSAIGLFTVRLGGDVNIDCTVNFADLNIVGSVMNTTPSFPGWNTGADLNNDQIVNIIDLQIVGSRYGTHC